MPRAFAATLLLAIACTGPNTHMERTVRVVDYTEKEGLLVGTVRTILPDDTLSCGREVPTGTHIAQRICRFQAESAFLRQRTQDMLHSSMGGGPARGEGPEGRGRSYAGDAL
ncbi:MAG TPA: hypothetical protein VFP52_04960 [Myxococcales bacterium]|nr:hypothetical protein [Myxococcales bacterium]